jgi:hypothetical protein
MLRLCIASVALTLPAMGRAQETGFFGTSQGFEIQPEVDVFYHVEEGVRLLLQVQDTAIPSEANNTLAVGGFADWFVAPVLRQLVSPDKSLTHALNLRLGVRYKATLDPGTAGTAQSLAIRFEVTPRLFGPWSILFSARNRLQVNWNLGSNDSVTYVYRGRVQAQREFDVAHPLRQRGVRLAVAAGDVEPVPHGSRTPDQRPLGWARTDLRGELLDGDVPAARPQLAAGAGGHLVPVLLATIHKTH